MNSGEPRRKLFKIWLTILVSLLLLFTGIQLFLRFYLDDYVENRFITSVSAHTDNQYKIDIGNLTLSVWYHQMELNDVRLRPTNPASTAPTVQFDQLSITDIQFLPFLFSGYVRAGNVQLINPVVTIVEDSPDSLTFLKSSGSSSTQIKTPTVEVGRFILDGGSLIYKTSNQSSSRAELHDFDLMISGIRMDSTSRTHPFFVDFESITTSTGNIRYAFRSGLYTIESHQTRYSTTENIVFIDSLKLVPQYPRYEFAKQIGHQQDRFDLTIAQLRFENPDIEKLQTGNLIADKFVIDKADLDVFHSKMLPDGPKSVKTFPQVAFKNLGFPVTVDTISINQSEIRYSEHYPDVSRPGTVTFANINGTFSDVTNDSTTINRGHEIILDVTSNVMGAAQLDAHFSIPMNENGDHSVQGSLTSMRAEQFNPILEPAGFVRAERGTIHSLQFMMDLGADSASGWTQLVYSDLKIAILDSENVNSGGRQWFQTLMANTFRIKENNNKEPYRRGEISMERLSTESIFTYWWESLSSGLKDNVGF